MTSAYTEERCKVCRSPNRLHYERLYFESRIGYHQLSREAKKLGENISWGSFRRHIISHVQGHLKRTAEIDQEFKRRREEYQRKILDSSIELAKNLARLNFMASALLQKELTVQTANAVRGIMSEIRLSLERLDRIHERERGGVTPFNKERAISELLEILSELDLDENHLQRLAKHLEYRRSLETGSSP
jgi:hypothetical protein